MKGIIERLSVVIKAEKEEIQEPARRMIRLIKKYHWEKVRGAYQVLNILNECILEARETTILERKTIKNFVIQRNIMNLTPEEKALIVYMSEKERL